MSSSSTRVSHIFQSTSVTQPKIYASDRISILKRNVINHDMRKTITENGNKFIKYTPTYDIFYSRYKMGCNIIKSKETVTNVGPARSCNNA